MTLRCQVLVVGAGVAGVPAAVAAARAGAETVIIERCQFPGGAGAAGLHQFIAGLYSNDVPPSYQFLNPGLAAEICGLMGERGTPRTAVRLGRVDILPYDHLIFREVLSVLMKHESRLQTLFGTAVKGAVFDGRRIASVLTDGGEILPDFVIDCSGDGVIIRSSAELHDVRPENERQLAGCTVRFRGIKDPDRMLAIRVPYVLREASDAGNLPPGLQFTVFSMGMEPTEGLCKMSLLPAGLRRGCTVEEAANIVHVILKKSLPEFVDSSIVEMSPDVLEREGARLRGEYTLTGEDIMACRRFPDGVVKNAWPMEIWDQGKGPTYSYLPAGSFYDIPLRCMKAAAAANLFCAGRCISVSPEALGSTRVMGACMALGEVAGREAAGMTPAG